MSALLLLDTLNDSTERLSRTRQVLSRRIKQDFQFLFYFILFIFQFLSYDTTHS